MGFMGRSVNINSIIREKALSYYVIDIFKEHIIVKQNTLKSKVY